MPLKPEEVVDMQESLKKLLELWMRTKLVFLKAFGDGVVQPEQENAFLQLKTEISRLYKRVAEALPSGLNFDGVKMTDMLKNSISMAQLKTQPIKDRQITLATWHTIYIKLNRALGALEVMSAGYFPHMHRASLEDKTKAPLRKKVVSSK